MNLDATEAWRREIRDYLLGRLAAGQQSIALPKPQAQRLEHAPIRRWWIFEGKRYPSLQGTLSSRWAEAIRAIRLLERTFNPSLKLSERAEGMVDWGQTFARASIGPHVEYVVHSSAVGLGEDERAALRGWMRWIASEWWPYAERFKLSSPAGVQEALEGLGACGRSDEPTFEQLRRWVHVARRSRWPLLRDLVAESLRSAVEPDALDHIPLPEERSTLFELLCLVRIAKEVAQPPDELRWLDRGLNENKISLQDVTCWYQQALEREAVLSTAEFGHGLAAVVPIFGLRVPQRIDLAFDLHKPRRGITGIVVEAKSGSQGFDETVSQLRVYRAARPRTDRGRYIVWGIVENAAGGAITETQLDCLRAEIECGGGDVWVFSGAESIGTVLRLLDA